jgi:FixJ family two-component response regulator
LKTLQPIVFVVDDDASVREALASLIRSVGLRVMPFASAQAFLQYARPDAESCLVLDVRLPDLTGLGLQHALAQAGEHIPIIFVTGHGDIQMSVRAMKAGAIEFLTKPFRDDELLAAIRQAIELDRAARGERFRKSEIDRRYSKLTSREREVLALVVKGKLNKQIASDLGITEITIKVHRRHVMEKMSAGSLAELVRMTERLSRTYT